MAPKFKLGTTRPRFSLHLMSGGSVGHLTEDSMVRVLYDKEVLNYCVYSVLMDANIPEKDIKEATCDEESIALMLTSKKQAKEVASQLKRTQVRYGRRTYTMGVKIRDKYVIITATAPIDADDDEELAID